MSPYILTILALVIYLGLLQRTLDRMRLSDRAALLFVGAMLLGTYLPDIPLGLIRINIGGAIIPLMLSIYLIGTANEAREQVRSLIAIIIVAASVLILDRILPSEPGSMFIDPLYAYGLVAGVVAYLAGRSRRAAFVAGMTGVMLADLVVLVQMLPMRMIQQFGGAGVLDSTVLAGIIAVGVAELVGETREYVSSNHRPKSGNKITVLDEKRRQKKRD